jgi:hypothetical protein
MGMYLPSKEGLLGVCILLLTSGALIIPTWPGEGGAYAVDGIIDKPKDVQGQKVNAGDDGHRSIDELALVVALNVFLNRPMKSREVIKFGRNEEIPQLWDFADYTYYIIVVSRIKS